jgi:hypothetical protein
MCANLPRVISVRPAGPLFRVTNEYSVGQLRPLASFNLSLGYLPASQDELSVAAHLIYI